jgi:hypothetical protein
MIDVTLKPSLKDHQTSQSLGESIEQPEMRPLISPDQCLFFEQPEVGPDRVPWDA